MFPAPSAWMADVFVQEATSEPKHLQGSLLKQIASSVHESTGLCPSSAGWPVGAQQVPPDPFISAAVTTGQAVIVAGQHPHQPIPCESVLLTNPAWRESTAH